MTAQVRRTDPKPGSRNWRHRAVCTPCQWAGYRFDSVDSAEKQATKHNEEKHMTELKPLKITLYARVGDSEVLNELAVIEREFQVTPITDANRAPGDAPEATVRVIDAEGAVRQMADAVMDVDRKRYMVISIDCLECNDGRANPVTVGEVDDFDEAIDLAEQRPYPGQEDRFVVDALNRVIVWSRASE